MEAPDGSNDMPDYGEEGDGRCTAETEALACEQYEDEAVDGKDDVAREDHPSRLTTKK